MVDWGLRDTGCCYTRLVAGTVLRAVGRGRRVALGCMHRIAAAKGHCSSHPVVVDRAGNLLAPAVRTNLVAVRRTAVGHIAGHTEVDRIEVADCTVGRIAEIGHTEVLEVRHRLAVAGMAIVKERRSLGEEQHIAGPGCIDCMGLT